MEPKDLLIDLAGRPREAASAIRDELTPTLLNAHPGGHPNSIAWLLWHTGREIDAQVADLSGEDEVWSAGGFDGRFDLGPLGDGIGLGHDPEQARSIRFDDPAPLYDYLSAATDELIRYIGTLSAADLDEVIDHNWDPPVTRGVRLASVIDDAAQHIGQAAYIAGMPDPG